MALPFLEPKKTVSIIVARRGKPGVETKAEMEAPGSAGVDEALKAAAEDLLRAIDERSVLGIAHAFQAAFQICEEQPHEEGPHLGQEE